MLTVANDRTVAAAFVAMSENIAFKQLRAMPSSLMSGKMISWSTDRSAGDSFLATASCYGRGGVEGR